MGSKTAVQGSMRRQLQIGRFREDIRESLLLGAWHSVGICFSHVMKSPSLQDFTTWLGKAAADPARCWQQSHLKQEAGLGSHQRSHPNNLFVVLCQAFLSLVKLNIRKFQLVQIQSFAKAIKSLVKMFYFFFFPQCLGSWSYIQVTNFLMWISTVPQKDASKRLQLQKKSLKSPPARENIDVDTS